MKINNKDIKEVFTGDVCSFCDITMNIEHETFLPKNRYLPIIHATTLTPQNRELIIDFVSANDMSDFASELNKPCVLDMEDGYLYDAILSGKSESQEGIAAYTGSYSFVVVKRKEMCTQTSDTFIVEGNCICSCIYEIQALEDVVNLEVDGMSIAELKKDACIVIDGIDKLVYEKSNPNVSAFDQVDMSEFPKLHPGSLSIVKNQDTCRIVIKYYPVFM